MKDKKDSRIEHIKMYGVLIIAAIITTGLMLQGESDKAIALFYVLISYSKNLPNKNQEHQ